MLILLILFSVNHAISFQCWPISKTMGKEKKDKINSLNINNIFLLVLLFNFTALDSQWYLADKNIQLERNFDFHIVYYDSTNLGKIKNKFEKKYIFTFILKK